MADFGLSRDPKGYQTEQERSDTDSLETDNSSDASATIDSRIEDESESSSHQGTEATPSQQSGITITSSSPCGLLSKLPIELRIMIYCEVLVSRNPIINAHGKMNYPPPILSNDCPPIEDIDAAILSTCRTIYEETYPILYSYNQFIFQSIEELRIFGASGANKQPERLSRMTPLLRHQIECYGRLAMLRTVTLRLGLPDRAAPSPMVARTCWLAWFELFTFHTNPNLEAIRFPVLEVLVLGFTDWRLTASKGHRVRVDPFMMKLRPVGGLSHLRLIGVRNERSIRDFKHGFVKEGGIFTLGTGPHSTTVTVSNQGTTMVSKAVREILQRNSLLIH